MNAYIYQADLLCEPCAIDIIREKLSSEPWISYQGKDGIVDCRAALCGHRWTPTTEEFNDSLSHAGWFVCPVCKWRQSAFDDYSFDSDDFPKGPEEDGGGESDSPSHCSSCGTFLENPLTLDGEACVRESGNHEWLEFYGLETEEEEEEEEEEEDKPEDGDLFTEDHIRFYECGHSDPISRRLNRGAVVIVKEDEDWRAVVKAYMDSQNYWPNVWFLSDHGNVSILSLEVSQ